ncbi:MAG: hypothetical protein AAF962_20260 [Actinomycetota bacterium]
MRLLRLDLGTGHSIDLHPFVTLLTELSETDRVDVVDAVRTLGAGSTAGVRGLVQHQGLLLELNGSISDHLLAATGAEVAIDCQHLAGADLNWLRDRIDLQRRRAEIAAVRVEELRADLRPAARAELVVLERRLAIAGPAPVATTTDVDDEPRRRLEAAIAGVEAAEPWIDTTPAGVPELRQGFADLERRRADSATHLERLDTMVARAQERVDEARLAAETAEEEARPALLTREQEARLELLSFPSMDESRKGKWRKTLRPEEQEEMESLLAIVGVDSWTGYTMYRTSPTVPVAKAEAMDETRRLLIETEQAMNEVQYRVDQDQLRGELAAEEETLRDAARNFLGMMLPSDVDAALGALSDRTANPRYNLAVDELAQALVYVGIAVADATDAHALLASARAALDDDGGDAVDAHQELQEELEAARRAHDGHRRALTRLQAAEAAATDAALGLARLEEQLVASGADDATGVDAILARIEPIATQVALEDNGSLPVVLFGELPVSADGEVDRLMAHLSHLSSYVQIILISSRAAVADWTAGVGLDKAMVTSPKAQVGSLHV